MKDEAGGPLAGKPVCHISVPDTCCHRSTFHRWTPNSALGMQRVSTSNMEVRLQWYIQSSDVRWRVS